MWSKGPRDVRVHPGYVVWTSSSTSSPVTDSRLVPWKPEFDRKKIIPRTLDHTLGNRCQARICVVLTALTARLHGLRATAAPSCIVTGTSR